MAKVTRLGRKSSEHYALRNSYKPASKQRRSGGKWVSGRTPEARATFERSEMNRRNKLEKRQFEAAQEQKRAFAEAQAKKPKPPQEPPK